MPDTFSTAELRSRITIYAMPLSAANAYGERLPTRQVVGSYWCSIKSLQGREADYVRQIAPKATHQIRMRWVPGITPTMQLDFKGRTFSIDSAIDPDERRRELQLFCTEKLTA